MKTSFITTLLLCGASILAAADLKLTRNPQNIQVENSGETYRINTSLRGSWGNILTFGKSDPDGVSLTIALGNGAVHPQVKPSDVKVETNTPEKIVITATYQLAQNGKANFPEKSINAVLRYTFVNGVPGVSVVGRMNGLEEVLLKNFSVNAGKKYDTYSVNGGEHIKNPADWKLLKGVNRKDQKGIAAFKADRRMFFYAPTNSVSNGGFFMSVVTPWHKLTLKAGEGKDFRFAVSLGATKEQDETLVSFCKGEKNIELPGTEKESSTASVRSPFQKPTKITVQFI